MRGVADTLGAETTQILGQVLRWTIALNLDEVVVVVDCLSHHPPVPLLLLELAAIALPETNRQVQGVLAAAVDGPIYFLEGTDIGDARLLQGVDVEVENMCQDCWSSTRTYWAFFNFGRWLGATSSQIVSLLLFLPSKPAILLLRFNLIVIGCINLKQGHAAVFGDGGVVRVRWF